MGTFSQKRHHGACRARHGGPRCPVTNAGAKLVVIDFHAVWCGPCKMIAPHLEEMSKTMNDVVFLKVDVDDCEDIAAKYNITAMPTFIFLKNKEKVADLTGANVDKLKEMVAPNK